MKTAKFKFFAPVICVLILIAIGILWSDDIPGGDYLTLLDRFEVTGPGALYPGWFDDFDNGLPDDWTNVGAWGPFGTWQDDPETSFARLESPGFFSGPVFGVYWYRTTIFSYNIWNSWVKAGSGDFQGTATFAAALPQINQYTWLCLHFDRFIDGKPYQEQIQVSLTNYAPEVAAILGLPGGLHIEQRRMLLDGQTWAVVEHTNFATESIIPPSPLGSVILAIKYIDDFQNPRFYTEYSITEDPELVVPFSEKPIPSNLDPSNIAFWSIDTGLVVPRVYLDIKPGSCPNPFNVKSRGVLPVAILGTESLDVHNINPSTVLLTRGEYPGVSPLRWSYEDVATPFYGPTCECHDLNGDGYLDLTLKFDTQELVETLGLDEEAGNTITIWLTGNLVQELGGTPIRGRDCIRIK
jgi:hypothetical protein